MDVLENNIIESLKDCKVEEVQLSKTDKLRCTVIARHTVCPVLDEKITIYSPSDEFITKLLNLEEESVGF